MCRRHVHVALRVALTAFKRQTEAKSLFLINAEWSRVFCTAYEVNRFPILNNKNELYLSDDARGVERINTESVVYK